MDPNVIQIRDAFFLAKRQYELTPGLLTDLTACVPFHHLTNISTTAQLQDWLDEVARSPYHYASPAKANEGLYGNVMGEVERIALELSDDQKAAAVEEFAKLGCVDLRVIDYATRKYDRIISQHDDYEEELTGLDLRHAVAGLLSAADAAALNKYIDAVKDGSLPAGIRDYVDFVRTLTPSEKDALLINNVLCGGSNEDVQELVSALSDSYRYCAGVIVARMAACDFDHRLSCTPRHLTFQLSAKEGGYSEEHRVALLTLDVDSADVWLTTGEHVDLEAQLKRSEDQCSDKARALILAVGEYLATTHIVLKPIDNEILKMREDPVIDSYRDLKAGYPRDILFLKQDGYYEAFGDDAVLAAQALRHNLWFRSIGYDGRTATIILTDEELIELRKVSGRVVVLSNIREPDDENLGMEPCFLNVLFRLAPTMDIEATVIETAGRKLAVRGNLGRGHFPPKDLSREDADYYQSICGKVEKDYAAKALLLMKNLNDIRKQADITYVE